MNKLTRRNLLKRSAAMTVAIPTLALGNRIAFASNAPRLDINDAQAKALAYTHKSAKPDSNCANCQLYSAASDAEWGPCAAFPGKQVAGAGWCSAWVKRA